jgi:SAM-dependent methyltransferase
MDRALWVMGGIMVINTIVRNPYLLEFTYQGANRWSAAYYTNRHDLVRRYAWAIPNHVALEKIATYAPRIVEIGAGTGYWAMLLTQCGCDVVAYDTEPYQNSQADNNHFPIEVGGPEKAQQHSDRALFLCWPPYDEPMATDALLAYEGDTLIYIGESSGGCTADKDFFALLGETFYDVIDDEYVEKKHDTNWTLVEEIDIPQWDGIHDGVYIYKQIESKPGRKHGGE